MQNFLVEYWNYISFYFTFFFSVSCINDYLNRSEPTFTAVSTGMKGDKIMTEHRGRATSEYPFSLLSTVLPLIIKLFSWKSSWFLNYLGRWSGNWIFGGQSFLRERGKEAGETNKKMWKWNKFNKRNRKLYDPYSWVRQRKTYQVFRRYNWALIALSSPCARIHKKKETNSIQNQFCSWQHSNTNFKTDLYKSNLSNLDYVLRRSRSIWCCTSLDRLDYSSCFCLFYCIWDVFRLKPFCCDSLAAANESARLTELEKKQRNQIIFPIYLSFVPT